MPTPNAQRLRDSYAHDNGREQRTVKENGHDGHALHRAIHGAAPDSDGPERPWTPWPEADLAAKGEE